MLEHGRGPVVVGIFHEGDVALRHELLDHEWPGADGLPRELFQTLLGGRRGDDAHGGSGGQGEEGRVGILELHLHGEVVHDLAADVGAHVALGRKGLGVRGPGCGRR